MSIRMNIYGALVNRVPEIRKRYHNMRDEQSTVLQRFFAWFYLLGLNVAWLMGWRGEDSGDDQDISRAKQLPETGESVLSRREPPEKVICSLKEYDLISFDVFDTLLFRPFSDPKDLFFLVGQKLNYLDFRRLRVEAETEARRIHRDKTGNNEVSLREIYEYLECEAGIPCEEGMQVELEMEEMLCFANPYFSEIFHGLKRAGKKIIAISDMYLPGDTVRRMLEKCGFSGLDACLVSCEYGMSKSAGNLFQMAEGTTSGKKSCIHIGDNPKSDVENARRAGWDSIYYKNVNQMGMRFRSLEMSAVVGSIYCGLVNAHIHNGLRVYSKDYEYGFIYGGILVLGYCQFIHEYVLQNHIGKVLFLARDGDILKKVYDRMYPEEAGKSCYVLWSRLAATKLAARYYKYDYFRRFLFHKVNQGFTLAQIFETMELEDMLTDLTDSTKGKLKPSTELTDKNAKEVRQYLTLRWDWVLSHYETQIKNGKEYFEKLLAQCDSAVAVDIGWAGSGAMALDVLINRILGLNCSITGLIAGTNSANSAEPDMSEAQLSNGKLVSYLFSQGCNRDLWRRHDPAKGDNVMMEKALASPYRSFRGFDKGSCIEALSDGRDAAQAREIQQGILDYCDMYLESPVSGRIGNISGRDAAAPIFMWMEGNRKKMEKEDCQCVLV